MKKRWIAMLSLLLVAIFLFSACGGNHGKALIKAGKEEISVNVFQLNLSRKRGELAKLGENTESNAYWKIRDADNRTQAEIYTAQVLEVMKHYAAALIIYQEQGLSLPKSVENTIDEYLEKLIQAAGSESELNAQLANYGANITVWRDDAILYEKVQQLKEHLFGEDASGILDSAKQAFFRNAYYRGKVLWLSNEYYLHDKDADGRSIYYLYDSNNNLTTHISYDTVNGTPVLEGGVTVYREYGEIAYDTQNGVATGERDDDYNLIYYIKGPDGKATDAIAYDIVNGRAVEEDGKTVYRKWVIAYDETEGKAGLHYQDNDGDGKLDIGKYDADTMAKKKLLAVDIHDECLDDEAKFDAAIEAYSSIAPEFYTKVASNGMYFAYGTRQTNALFASYSQKLEELDEGDIGMIITSDATTGEEIGYYLLMRCELDEDYQAWKDPANETWFQSFAELVSEYQLQKMTVEYFDRLEIDEALLATVDITKVSTNIIC